jgi:drug/metabolite transporter (DMT)-like permease
MPYYFIALALEDFSTVSIVWLRVTIGALILLPVALAKKTVLPALRHWRWVAAFAVLEMVIPWWLITESEKTISTSLVGLLVTTVPFVAALVLGLLGDRSAWHPKTVLGLVIGFSGVLALVGIDAFTGNVSVVAVGMVLAAAVGYATAPILADRNLSDVPTLGVVSVSMVVVSLVYSIPAFFSLPADLEASPSVQAWVSIAVLGVVASALGFVVFFALIKEIGAGRSTLVTYVNLLVAILLGVVFLEEPITVGLLVGLPLVVAGSYLASRKRSAYVRKRHRKVTEATGEIGLPEHL